jgi:hypothetical protein
VVQPVIQFGTSIHGKSLSGGAPNRGQKLLAFAHSLSIPREKKWNFA